MIITLSFINGFQDGVSKKVFSFWGHIHVQRFMSGKSLVAEESPLTKNDSAINIIKTIKGIQQVQAYGTKSAVVEHNKNIEGILFKGVEPNYAFNNLKTFLVAGSFPKFNDSLYSKEIMLSAAIANQLEAKVNDTINIFFISATDNKSNQRKLRISGIFKTGIEEYDKLFAIGDIRLIQRLNNWQSNEVGGYEIFIDHYKNMDTINQQILDGYLPDVWASKTIKSIYPNIFDWLGVQDTNRNVIIIIMAIVAIINLITCLIILVLERTRMAGVLKATGANNWLVQKIFLYHATAIALVGIGLGFIVGVGVCLLQQKFNLITLDETVYSIATAEVKIVWWQIGLVCSGTLVVCFIALLLPTFLVRNIKPVKAIQFR